jgi:putative ABC transport system permease protein
MLRNYFLTAWRHLFKQGGYSLINLAGLAAALASFILIALFVQYELSYDKYHANADRIYRFSRDFYAFEGQEARTTAANGPAAGPLLAQDFPEIEKTVRIGNCGGQGFGVLLASEDKAFFENGYATADNTIFEVFDIPWIAGNRSTALTRPGTIVLGQNAAIKYFGTTDVVGETLLLESRVPLQVTGVMGDLPRNTHFGFTMLGSVLNATIVGAPNVLEGWFLNCFHTYGLLGEDADVGSIQAQSSEFIERHLGEGRSRAQGFLMQPLSDLHLRSTAADEMTQPGSMTMVLSFSAIAVFILMLAAINFVNLATARASLRAREVGVRKTVGASRSELFGQFMGESVLLVLFSAIIAIALVAAVLPVFADFVRRDINLDVLTQPGVLGFILGSAVLVGLVAGSYPSLFLSGFRPVRVLRGDVTRGKAAGVLRKVLVIGQFTISVALIIAAIIVYQQMQYARNIELGFDKDLVVVLQGAPTVGVGRQWEPMQQRLRSHPEILEATASRVVPGTQVANTIQVSTGRDAPISLPALFVEFGFFETYRIDIVAGRAFSEEFGIDRIARTGDGDEQTATGSFIVSEMAARRLGTESSEELVGQVLRFGDADGTVVGVAQDVYFESIRRQIDPLVYFIPAQRRSVDAPLQNVSVRITGNNLADTLEFIDRTWVEFEPDQPVTRRFLDQDFQALYDNEERQGRMLFSFSLLAIVIACLGLLGLATFAILQRTKEIGIRRVMGGSVWDIVKLFVVEFGRPVLLASLIAWPIAYVAMSRWLENFAYQVDIGLLPFLVSTGVALLVACLTVGSAAVRAAISNPVHALRYE